MEKMRGKEREEYIFWGENFVWDKSVINDNFLFIFIVLIIKLLNYK